MSLFLPGLLFLLSFWWQLSCTRDCLQLRRQLGSEAKKVSTGETFGTFPAIGRREPLLIGEHAKPDF